MTDIISSTRVIRRPATRPDAVIVYADIVRPAGREADLPILVAWSPYGKQDTGSLLDMIPGRAAIAPDALSNLQKWEGTDPGYRCAHGYAVANVDPRGVNSSGGDAQFWSESEGRDGCDVIEWLAAQSWSKRESRDGRQLLVGGVAVVHRGPTAAASGGDRALGRDE
jgi:predicted acyl esterase